jgi:hemolysin III
MPHTDSTQLELSAGTAGNMIEHFFPQQAVPAWRRTSDEEFANTITHGFGLALAVVGAVVMWADVAAYSNARFAVGCAAYLFSLLAVYAMSTLSHGTTSLRWKLLFRKLDQAFIYLLIVGSYTPYAVAYLHGGFWPILLAFMWVFALAGFVSKAFFEHRVNCSSVTSYVFLGWMSIIAIPTLWHIVPAGEMAFILGGGVWYMLGILFFVNDEKVRHFHAIWHLCVIAGSACHFLGLMLYVVQA